MGRFLRSLLTVLMSFALCIAGFLNPVLAEDENPAETEREEAEETVEEIPAAGFDVPDVVCELSEDNIYYGSIEGGETQWLSFTPGKDNSYDFSVGSLNTTVSLIDDEGTLLNTELDTGSGVCFTSEMEANRTYYLKLEEDDSTSGGYHAYVSQTPPIISEVIGGTEFEVGYGESITLEISAYSRYGEIVSYQWSASEGNDLPAVTDQNTLMIESATYSDYYYCEIADDCGNTDWVPIRVSVNHFSVSTDISSPISVISGSDEELKVNVTGDDLSHVVYEWSVCDVDENGWDAIGEEEVISGAVTDTYLAENVQQNKRYICRISDGYGNEKEIEFTLLVIEIAAELPVDEWIDVDLGDEAAHSWLSFTVPEDYHYIIKASANEQCSLTLYEKGNNSEYYSSSVSEGVRTVFDGIYNKDSLYLLQTYGSGTLRIKILPAVKITYVAGDQGFFHIGEDEIVHTYEEYVDPEEKVYIKNPETDSDSVRFDGWYKDPELTDPLYIVEDVYVTEDTTLYASYRSYAVVKLHAGDGMTFGDGNEVVYNTLVNGETRLVRDLYYPAVEGYVVSDWYDNPELNGEPLDKDMEISETMDLYAKWSESLKVEFNAGDGYLYVDPQGVVQRNYALTVAVGDTIYVPIPKHDTKAFEQWYATSDFRPGSELGENTYEITAEESVTYYAKYIDAVKVTYDANGGVFKDYFESQQNLPKGSAFRNYVGVVTHANPNKLFVGWSLSKNSKDIISGNYVLNKNITVYAIWEDGVSVRLVGSGVHFENYGEEYTEADNEITVKVSKGKTFDNGLNVYAEAKDSNSYIEGWYTDAAFKNRIDTGSYTFTKDVTLYAKVAARPASEGIIVYTMHGFEYLPVPFAKELKAGETNNLYLPARSYFDINIDSVPDGSILNDGGTASFVSGSNVDFMYQDYFGGTFSSFHYQAVEPGTSVIRIEADGKTYELSVTVPEKIFEDVTSPSQYYYDAVYWAVDNGITQGMGPTTFNPSGFCKRYQFVLFLWRQAGQPEPTLKTDPFTDVKADPKKDAYEKAVLWAVENGITTGTTKTTFDPYAPLTRGQVVTFLYRAAGEPEVTTTANPFRDLDSSKYYYKPVLWAVENSITTGLNATQFGPTNTCTRGQTVLFMYRMFK